MGNSVVKIILPGGRGQLGRILSRHLASAGCEVVVLSRNNSDIESDPRCRVVEWDGRTLGDWVSELNGAAAVYNLAGQSVNCRYNRSNREAILNSRIDSTRVIGEAIRAVDRPPNVWLQSSTATIYSHRLEAANGEFTGEIGVGADAPNSWRFSLDVAKAWESAALEFERKIPTRLILTRSAMVMSADRGSVFDVFVESRSTWFGRPTRKWASVYLLDPCDRLLSGRRSIDP